MTEACQYSHRYRNVQNNKENENEKLCDVGCGRGDDDHGFWRSVRRQVLPEAEEQVLRPADLLLPDCSTLLPGEELLPDRLCRSGSVLPADLLLQAEELLQRDPVLQRCPGLCRSGLHLGLRRCPQEG